MIRRQAIDSATKTLCEFIQHVFGHVRQPADPRHHILALLRTQTRQEGCRPPWRNFGEHDGFRLRVLVTEQGEQPIVTELVEKFQGRGGSGDRVDGCLTQGSGEGFQRPAPFHRIDVNHGGGFMLDPLPRPKR